MKQALVDKIVDAVLYEGYMLYPYRPSVKNRQRWTFGGLYPPAYSQEVRGSDASAMQTECLVRGGECTTLQVSIRFLHLLDRHVGELIAPRTELPEGEEPAFRVVDRLQVGDRQVRAWQEAEERDVPLDVLALPTLVARPHASSFAFPSRRRFEPVPDPAGTIVGVVVREQRAIAGVVEVSAEPAAEGLFRLRVRIENQTPLEDAGRKSRDEALMRSLVSTHTVLGVREGSFVSLIDPPDDCLASAGSCRNVGTWPVLVGEAGDEDTVLSSPITLYDYPQVSPESPGDLFDGTEIDEILTLRILTLSDAERREAAAVDERTLAMMQRTEALVRDQLLGLHGSVRGLRPAREEGRP